MPEPTALFFQLTHHGVTTDYFPENDIRMDDPAPHKNTLRPIQSLEQFLHVCFVNHKIEALFPKVL